MLQFLQLSRITVHGVGNRFIFVRPYFFRNFLARSVFPYSEGQRTANWMMSRCMIARLIEILIRGINK
jgi:hypothetical protein